MEIGSGDVKEVTTPLSDNEIQGLARPTGTATGLPGRAYYDEAFYEAERKHVFAANWTGVGFGSDVPNPGDIKPVSVAGYELLLVRGKDAKVNVYHNICRHRGMKLAKAAGNVRTIRCSYHCWTYGLDGQLLATPSIAGVNENRAEDFNYNELGLIQVRSGQYFDIIFVNIDGKALELSEHLRPVRERLEGTFDFSILRAADAASGRGSRDIAVNWKVVVEGGIEDYHLPFVHRVFSHSKIYVTEDGGDIYSGFSSKRGIAEAQERYATKASDGNVLPIFPDMEKTGTAEAVILFVFPNTIISCTPSYVSGSLQLPLGPGNTRYTSRTYFIGEAATAPEYKKLRDENTIYWKEVLDEDDEPWREVQAMARVREDLGLESRFSPHWERALHIFQKFIANHVKAAGS
ncbi:MULTISPECIES: aromatic ring-hydroxylating dioxygenase subunit alpha [unclassified Bradyrhizobium]|uniref:aromatic ring-hydroxylating oxygenase subunit alpha n=1 Tax=unclassified Bradyrhizobium TaxID=2631580 RepID=UPI001FF86223|nr:MULTISPECIES: aromatic ring-hydroxylating dioxygenase subunit alpha [unclassified Bradyrhizobium]MCK1710435.1 aromatic ring-hydroxylating dioxygenase subunit alpha [Bradyrhizobium sp. 143]MCK1728268.1 aromatic ring-hydroxylating dioxygenase subunit alpha [Bradyrhizobium sp. 142]